MLQVLSAGPANETNIITLAPLKSQGTTNVAINLTKFPVPIVMTVTTGESDVDYRVDVRLGSRGPNAVVDMIGTSSLSPTDDVTMISFIDGQPPRGAERVGTSSHDVEAWLYEKMMYVRTTTELMSPAYIAKSSGNAGVSVYKLGETPVLIVSRDGRMATVAMKR
jgi:intracellular multiplication protein IcmK